MQQLIPIISQIRSDHPVMSIKWIYQRIHPETMGRDTFYAFCAEYGFLMDQKRNYRRTTNSNGVIRFPNLIEGMELTGVNQVWVSDITYYELGERFYYITFILDLWSRRIIGYTVSHSLRAEQTTLPALKMAINCRRPIKIAGVIFHSDGGGQYYCKDFLGITSNYQISNSMAECVYENPHAERINRTIKDDYLYHYNPTSFQQLKKMTAKAVWFYNNEKPHKALNGITPVKLESKQIKLSTKIKVVNKEKRSKKESNTNNNNKFTITPKKVKVI